MIIYVDNEYKCHTTSADNLREFDAPFFNGKCEKFIEGYRYVPEGECWTREDGTMFVGEMVSPWKPYTELDEA
jgi:hypothetical protein